MRTSLQRVIFWGGPILLLLFITAGPLSSKARTTEPSDCIPQKKVADYIKNVRDADRAIYKRQVVDRMEKQGIVKAEKDWEQNNGLPLPDQFLELADILVSEKERGISSKEKTTEPSDCIPPEKVADDIHDVIEADRTIYTKQVVVRMEKQGIVKAEENWETTNEGLPLPAQFLQSAGRLVRKKERGIKYRLISLWPINKDNGPYTDFERKGLDAVREDSDQAHTKFVFSGKKKYFQAIYADKAVTKTCIKCHNNHPLSPKRDFEPGDVMGAIVITIPLKK